MADGVEVVIACLISDIVLTIEKAWEHGTLRNAKFQMLPRVDQREVYREAIPPSLHAACCLVYVACRMFHVAFWMLHARQCLGLRTFGPSLP